jgi:hypothetical protein
MSLSPYPGNGVRVQPHRERFAGGGRECAMRTVTLKGVDVTLVTNDETGAVTQIGDALAKLATGTLVITDRETGGLAMWEPRGVRWEIDRVDTSGMTVEDSASAPADGEPAS